MVRRELNYENNSFIDGDYNIEVIALSAGDYGDHGLLKDNVLERSCDKFIGLPVYFSHQMTPETLLGKIIDSRFNDGKVFTKIKLFCKTDFQQEVIKDISNGFVDKISTSFLSDDIKFQNTIIMSDIIPKEVSILGLGMIPVCKVCTIKAKSFCEDSLEDMSNAELVLQSYKEDGEEVQKELTRRGIWHR